MRSANPACDDRTLVANIASMDRLIQELKDEADVPIPPWNQPTPHTQMPSIRDRELFYSARRTYARLVHAGVQAVLQTILQELDLPKSLRAQIEAWARYFSRKSSPGGGRKDYATPRPFYDAQVAKYKQMMSDIHDARRVGVSHGVCMAVDPARAVMAGPFTLVNTGGFSPETMAKVKGVVEEAARLIEAKGLGVILYGDIYVTNTISRSRILAFYEPDTDEMFVRANVKHDIDTTRTIIHELGHRLDFMFMRTRGSNLALQKLYSKVRDAHRGHMSERDRELTEKIKLGDVVTIKGKKYTVVAAFEPTTVRLKIDGSEPNRPWTHKISREALAQLMAGHTRLLGPFGAFVSKYASTSPIENFAEMFAFWAMDKLPPQQAEWFVEALPPALLQSNQSATKEAGRLLEALGGQREALQHALGEVASWKKNLFDAKKAKRGGTGADEIEYAKGMVQFWARVADLLRERTLIWRLVRPLEIRPPVESLAGPSR